MRCQFSKSLLANNASLSSVTGSKSGFHDRRVAPDFVLLFPILSDISSIALLSRKYNKKCTGWWHVDIIMHWVEKRFIALMPYVWAVVHFENDCITQFNGMVAFFESDLRNIKFNMKDILDIKYPVIPEKCGFDNFSGRPVPCFCDSQFTP